MLYTLDLNIWRCGDERTDGVHGLGERYTSLINDAGFMCCLGQFAQQQGVPYEKLLWACDPAELAGDCGLYDEAFVENEDGSFITTNLASDMIGYNDDYSTTIEQKIEKIRSLLEEHGHSLTVIPLKESV